MTTFLLSFFAVAMTMLYMATKPAPKPARTYTQGQSFSIETGEPTNLSGQNPASSTPSANPRLED